MGSKTLIQNCTLFDPETPSASRSGISILIEGDRIRSISEVSIGSVDADAIVDGTNMLVIPGLVNSHTHSAENVLKGRNWGLPLETWLVEMFGTCPEYTPRLVYLSAMIGAIEMLKTGSTAVLDHLWISPGLTGERLDAAMRAYADAGIRAVVAPLIDDTDITVEYGESMGFPLKSTFFGMRHASRPPIEDQVSMLAEFFDKWHGTEGGRLLCFAGPTGIQWCTEKLLTLLHDLTAKYNSRIHIHAVETKVQSLACRWYLGKSGIKWLRDVGVLGPKVSLAHTVWPDEDDIELIAESGAQVVHNPAANLRLGSGLCPVRRLLDAGAIVALGTDGAASSDNQVMFDVIKLTSLIHNVQNPAVDTWVTPKEAVRMATVSGAAVFGLEGELGVLQEGALADIVLLDTSQTTLTPLNNVFAQLGFCETGLSVNTVFVNGKLVVRDRKLLTVDENEILTETRELLKDSVLRTGIISKRELDFAMEQWQSFRDYVVRL